MKLGKLLAEHILQFKKLLIIIKIMEAWTWTNSMLMFLLYKKNLFLTNSTIVAPCTLNYVNNIT